MRIISGSAGGRKIAVPKGSTVRPTTDRVREALFSHLGLKVEDARVLDLFAGSGSLGLESLSRGANEVTFVEKSKRTATNLLVNIETLGFKDRTKVIVRDAISFLQGAGEAGFDLVFIDPPYDSQLIAKSLEIINKNGLLCHQGTIVAEHSDGNVPDVPENLKMITTRKYGNTSITTFEWLNK